MVAKQYFLDFKDTSGYISSAFADFETTSSLPLLSEVTLNSTVMKEEIEFLKNVPILCDLEPMDVDTIAKVGVRKKYKKGSIILLEEEGGAALFVIISGKVKIVRMDDDGREVILSILGESDFFGEMAILDG